MYNYLFWYNLQGRAEGEIEAVFSPSFSATPFAHTFGVTPKILSATPNFLRSPALMNGGF